MGKLIERIPGLCPLISNFSKPCPENLISKDTHLVFSIYDLINPPLQLCSGNSNAINKYVQKLSHDIF